MNTAVNIKWSNSSTNNSRIIIAVISIGYTIHFKHPSTQLSQLMDIIRHAEELISEPKTLHPLRFA
jgi:hypothetical protein